MNRYTWTLDLEVEDTRSRFDRIFPDLSVVILANNLVLDIRAAHNVLKFSIGSSVVLAPTFDLGLYLLWDFIQNGTPLENNLNPIAPISEIDQYLLQKSGILAMTLLPYLGESGSGSQVHTIAVRRLPSRTYQDGPKEHTVNRYATQTGTGFTMNSSVLSALSAKDYITETGVLTA